MTYQNPGSFAVQLKITCENGSVDSVIITDYIHVNQCGQEMDFGDAPDPSYPTLLASNGARHIIDPDVYLGSKIDGEADGQPSSGASADDNDGNDDEDGIVFQNNLVPGAYTTFVATVSRNGYLGVWVDFNGNGSWADPGESIFDHDTTVVAGANTWGFLVPQNAVPGNTIARFRYSTISGMDYEGEWPDGEVEDYQVEIAGEGQRASVGDWVWHDLNHDGLQDSGEPGLDSVQVSLFDQNGNQLASTLTNSTGFYLFTNVTPGSYFIRFSLRSGFSFSPPDQGADDTIDSDAQYGTGDTPIFALSAGEYITNMDAGMYRSEEENEFDFGDAPAERYPTLFGQNGALHIINPEIFLGYRIDAEPDGQPHPEAMGDDIDSIDDDDGIIFTAPTGGDSSAYVEVLASHSGFLNAWMDFDNYGNWADADEHIIIDEPVTGGSTVLKVDVPEGVSQGKLFSRFRFSTVPGLTFVGIAIDGEVENYWVDLIFDKVETADQNNSLPTGFRLYQNYPNPFNSSTEISFDLPKAAKVQLSIYNLMGVELQVLVNEQKTAGFHRIIWDGKDRQNNQMPSGIYIYRLKAGEFSAVKKLISLK